MKLVSGSGSFLLRKGSGVQQFSAAWPHVSVISVIDVVLVAFVIYELLALIKGTRAALMLVGVAGLGLAFYLSRLGNLATLNWLISTLLPYTVFALIVVFAAEIRQALARLGRRLTLSRSAASEADAYDDIVLAANLFCQNQTGALIVIEREIGLRTYIESGVPLDAQLSYDLLATIFRPSAPLHDGAVIVAKGPYRRCGLLFAAFHEPGLVHPAWHAASRRHWRDRGDRCHRGNRFGGDGQYQPGGRRKDRARSYGRTAARSAGGIAAPLRLALDVADADQQRQRSAGKRGEFAQFLAAACGLTPEPGHGRLADERLAAPLYASPTWA